MYDIDLSITMVHLFVSGDVECLHEECGHPYRQARLTSKSTSRTSIVRN